MSITAAAKPVAGLFLGDDAFDEFNKYLNAMMQGDYSGEVLLVVREGFNLTSKVIDPDDIIMGLPEGCELVVLDGGNTDGAAWKLVYHPARRVSTLINED